MQKIIHEDAPYATSVANQHLREGWKYVACYAYSAEYRPAPRYSEYKTTHGEIPTQFKQCLVIVLEKKEEV